MRSKNYVCVTGIMGTGKSELVPALAKEFDFEPGLTGVSENPHLAAFYCDMKKHALEMSLWDLDHRLGRHKRFLSRISSGEVKGVVAENTLWEGAMFAGMLNRHPDKLLSDLEHGAYMGEFHRAVDGEIPFPQLIVHLDCTTAAVMTRLRERGMLNLERGVSEEYLDSLRENYGKLLQGLASSGARVLRLDWMTVLSAAETAKLIREHAD